jgi:hypothetical protein
MPVIKRRLDAELGCESQLVSPDVIVAEGAAIKAASAADQDALISTTDSRIQLFLAYPPVTERVRRVPIKGELRGEPVPCTIVLTDVDTGQQELRTVDQQRRTFLFLRDLRPSQTNELTLRVQREGEDEDLCEHPFEIRQDPNYSTSDTGRESLAIPILIETRRGFETLFAANARFPIKGEMRLRTPDGSGQFRVPFYEGDAYRAEIVIKDAPPRQGEPFVVRAVLSEEYKVTAEVLLEDGRDKAPSIEFGVDQPRRLRTIDDLLPDLERLRARLGERLVDMDDRTRRARLRARHERIEREIQQELESIRPELGHLEDLIAQLQKLVAEAGMAPQLTPPFDELVLELQDKRRYAPTPEDITTLNQLLEDAQHAWDAQDRDRYDPAVRACRDLTKGWRPVHVRPVDGPGGPPPPPPPPQELRRSDLEQLEMCLEMVQAWPASGAEHRDRLAADISAAMDKLRAARDVSIVNVHNNTVVPIFHRVQAGPVDGRVGPAPPDPFQRT